MRVEPDGQIPCDLAIFGEAPGYEEQIEGRGFVGKAGKQLWSNMKRFCDLDRGDFYVSNIVKVALPKNRDPKPDEIAMAMPEFLDELELVKPRVVITAGGFATRAMLGNLKMSDVHGIPHWAEIAGNKYICFPLYHPAAGLHNKGFLSAFAYDLDRLKELLDDDLAPWEPSPQPVRCSWLTGAATRRVLTLAGMNRTVAVDTEGWEDKPWGLSFSFDGVNGFVIRADDKRAIAFFTEWLSQQSIVVMHNGVHDVPVLRAMGVANIGVYHDTQILAYHEMLRTGSGVLEAESQNLGTLAYRECQLRLGELTDCAGVDFDTQEIPYSDEVMEYAGADPCATWRLFEVYRERGIVDLLPYNIDMGQVPLVGGMIAHGMPFDLDAAIEYYADVLDKLEALTEELRTIAARYGNRDFNPGSHLQVRELLTRRIGLRIRKRTKGGLASTNEKALADHQEHPFVKKLQAHRELVKLRGTYAEPLIEELSRGNV